MIYDTQTIQHNYRNYVNVGQKINSEIKKRKIIRIRRGLYSDDLFRDAPLIANICYSPSYLSFEYALSYYGLIPERVSVFTSATFNKKNNKRFLLDDICFEYRGVPSRVYDKGLILLTNENGHQFKIAIKEKALCDQLYAMYPVRSIKNLKVLLFDDLRIDEGELSKLNFSFIKRIAPLYHSSTINTFIKYIKEAKYE